MSEQNGRMQITQVQQWVGSVLVFMVGMVPAASLAWVSVHYAGDDRRGDGVGLWVMCGVIGLATLAGCLAIHRRSFASFWLLLGLLPAAVAAPYLF